MEVCCKRKRRDERSSTTIFEQLPDELLFLIFQYLDTNREAESFLRTCKRFYTLKKYGCLKKIQYHWDWSIVNIMLSLTKHYRTLNSICFTQIVNPQEWLPVWPHTVYFCSCKITLPINPKEKADTIKLVIQGSDKDIQINLDKFPKLKYIYRLQNTFNTSLIIDYIEQSPIIYIKKEGYFNIQHDVRIECVEDEKEIEIKKRKSEGKNKLEIWREDITVTEEFFRHFINHLGSRYF